MFGNLGRAVCLAVFIIPPFGHPYPLQYPVTEGGGSSGGGTSAYIRPASLTTVPANDPVAVMKKLADVLTTNSFSIDMRSDDTGELSGSRRPGNNAVERIDIWIERGLNNPKAYNIHFEYQWLEPVIGKIQTLSRVPKSDQFIYEHSHKIKEAIINLSR